MYFWYSQNSIRGLKMAFPVNFRFISVEISAEKDFFGKFLFHQKIRLWISGTYFWAIMLISAVTSILEDFGSLLPACPVAVE